MEVLVLENGDVCSGEICSGLLRHGDWMASRHLLNAATSRQLIGCVLCAKNRSVKKHKFDYRK